MSAVSHLECTALTASQVAWLLACAMRYPQTARTAIRRRRRLRWDALAVASSWQHCLVSRSCAARLLRAERTRQTSPLRAQIPSTPSIGARSGRLSGRVAARRLPAGAARASRSSTYYGTVPASRQIPEGVELSRILSAGLRAADAAGVRRVTPEHLPVSDFAQLCDGTLAFLHEQPSSPSPMPEHWMVSARAAGVMPFWAAALGIVDDEEQRTRLRTLRMAVYDHLDGEARIVKEPGQACPCTSRPGGPAGRTGPRTRRPKAPASARPS